MVAILGQSRWGEEGWGEEGYSGGLEDGWKDLELEPNGRFLVEFG